jgi:hypothetical protein
MIFCVVPPELKDQLYDKLVAHYEGNPSVTVIVDRRTGPDRRKAGSNVPGGKRQVRDRRRQRIAGTFPETEAYER